MKKGKSHTTSQNAKRIAHIHVHADARAHTDHTRTTAQARQRPGKSHHYDHSDYDTPQSEED